MLTNQPYAPKGVVDSDAYSHISFVRTLQDMFGLADPGDDWSYMNRSKYTESFIAAHLVNLPEYANSADPHFDAVRPMNHAFVIPSGYAQKTASSRRRARSRAGREPVERLGAQVRSADRGAATVTPARILPGGTSRMSSSVCTRLTVRADLVSITSLTGVGGRPVRAAR